MDELICYSPYHNMWAIKECISNRVMTHLVPQYTNGDIGEEKTTYSLKPFLPQHMPLEDRDSVTQQFNYINYQKTYKSGYVSTDKQFNLNGKPVASISRHSRQPNAIMQSKEKEITYYVQEIKFTPRCFGYYISNIAVHYSYGEALFVLLTTQDVIQFVAEQVQDNLQMIKSEGYLNIKLDSKLPLTDITPEHTTYTHLGIAATSKSSYNYNAKVILKSGTVGKENLARYVKHNTPLVFRNLDFYLYQDKIVKGYEIEHYASLKKIILSLLEESTTHSILKDNLYACDNGIAQAVQNAKWALFFKPHSIIESKSSVVSVINDVKEVVKDVGFELAQGYSYQYPTMQSYPSRERGILNYIYHNLINLLGFNIFTIQESQYDIFYNKGLLPKIKALYIKPHGISEDILNFKYTFVSDVEALSLEKKDPMYEVNYLNLEDTIARVQLLPLQRPTIVPVDVAQNYYIPCMCLVDSCIGFYSYKEIFNKIKDILKIGLGANGLNYLPCIINHSYAPIRSRAINVLSYSEEKSIIKIMDDYKLPKGSLDKILIKVKPLYKYLKQPILNDKFSRLPVKEDLPYVYNPFTFNADYSAYENEICNEYVVRYDVNLTVNNLGPLRNNIVSDINILYNKDKENKIAFWKNYDITLVDFLEKYAHPVFDLAIISFLNLNTSKMKEIISGYIYDITDLIYIGESEIDLFLTPSSAQREPLNADMQHLNYLHPADFESLIDLTLYPKYTQVKDISKSINKLIYNKPKTQEEIDLLIINKTINDTFQTLAVPMVTFERDDSLPIQGSTEAGLVKYVLENSYEYQFSKLSKDTICLRPESTRSLNYVLDTFISKTIQITDDLVQTYMNMHTGYNNDLYFMAQTSHLFNPKRSTMERRLGLLDVSPCNYLNIPFSEVSGNLNTTITLEEGLEWQYTDEKSKSNNTIGMVKRFIENSKSTNVYPVVRIKELPSYACIEKDKIFYIFNTGKEIKNYANEISYAQILSSYVTEKKGDL